MNISTGDGRSSKNTKGILNLSASFQTIEHEDNRRLADIKRRQRKAHWLQRTAAKRLGLNYKKLLRWDIVLDNERSSSVLKRATSNRLTPELRWALAYRIRRSNIVFEAGVTKSLMNAAGVTTDAAVKIYTVTTEDLYDTDEEEHNWLRHDTSTMSWEVRPEFTGQLDVIVDMESIPDEDEKIVTSTLVNEDEEPHDDSRLLILDDLDYGKTSMAYELRSATAGGDGEILIEAVERHGDGSASVSCVFESSDVARMLEFLEESKACRLFNEVDGRQARYRWEEDHWEIIRYPIVMSMYERSEMQARLDRKTSNSSIDGFTEHNAGRFGTPLSTKDAITTHPQIRP